ncbi:MAG: tRNA (adenosine(37)-N6)-threonylcarbamoyltransferase complex dimerization subunit type 1 TsaB [Clostridiales bacterium]|nr:tRNA (adenosine(37)-N6)-threonylcarbamoyltransferase complex dimerization subunit type 1 TsaB [Clostridiales bacterium]
MTILGLDTSGPACSAALTRDGQLVQEIVLNTALTHSETLMPAIERVMEGANASVSDLDAIAVVAGPGSFTGVRIGVCAGRALAHAGNKPVCRINSLEALAAGAPNARGIVCPILDARRMQVYSAAFHVDAEGKITRILPDDARKLTDFLNELPHDEELYFTGDGVSVHESAIREIVGSRARFAPVHARILRASSACFLAEGKKDEWAKYDSLTPIYLRAPQAERERNEKLTRQKV